MKTKPIKLTETPQVYDVLSSSEYQHIDSNRACSHTNIKFLLSISGGRVMVTTITTWFDADCNEIGTKATSHDIGLAESGLKIYRKDGGYLKIAKSLPGIECVAVI